MRLRETGLPDAEQVYKDHFVLPFEKASPIDDRSIYSARLEHLVKDCLNPISRKRVSLRDLGALVNTGIQLLKEIKPNMNTRSENELPQADRVPVRRDNLPLTGDYSEIKKQRNDYTGSPDPSEGHIGSETEYSTADDDTDDDN